MDKEIISGFIYNASLLLSLSLVYILLFLKYDRYDLRRKIISGILIGLIGIMIMENNVQITQGIFFDTKSVLVSVTAMFLDLYQPLLHF